MQQGFYFANLRYKYYASMKKFVNLLLISLSVCSLHACNSNAERAESPKEPEFPYQTYLDSIGEDDWFPTIGDDGDGFVAISDNIRYPEMPDSLSSNHFADSLFQLYNITIAFNTIIHDVNSATRYIEETDFVSDYADALDSINVSGIHDPEIKGALVKISRKAAESIRSGKKPFELLNDEMGEFYKVFNAFRYPLYDAHLSDEEFKPSEVLDDYADIHSKAISDTTTFRSELLRQVIRESDFSKKCVLAREFAYANYKSPDRDDLELVAVIDPILRANKYSPLLGELWLIWRVALQNDIFSGVSNDSAIYNLFYNDMRNRIVQVYIAYLKNHPHDKLAFREFVSTVKVYNVTRNHNFGNSSILDEMYLYDEIWNSDEVTD